jgi:hypothetical protein
MTPTPPMTPADMLALAQVQMMKLLTGTAVVEIDTPQLGRVMFSQANMGDLQRWIDYLNRQVNPCGPARGPLSFEAWP